MKIAQSFALLVSALLLLHPPTSGPCGGGGFVRGAPTSSPSSVTSAPATTSFSSSRDDVTSCLTPISTSPSWLQSSGDWERPCSPGGEASSATGSKSFLPMLSADQQTQTLWEAFFVRASAESVAMDTVATLEEGADVAEDLRKNILEGYLENLDSVAQVLNSKTLIAGARDRGVSTANSTQQEVNEQYKKLSLALVYLEQCRHDEQQCSQNNGTAATDTATATARNLLLDLYEDLSTKLLQALCKLSGLYGTSPFPSSPPTVLRSAMPPAHRSLEGEGVGVSEAAAAAAARQRARHYRDYVMAADVRRLLLDGAARLNASDWSSV